MITLRLVLRMLLTDLHVIYHNEESDKTLHNSSPLLLFQNAVHNAFNNHNIYLKNRLRSKEAQRAPTKKSKVGTWVHIITWRASGDCCVITADSGNRMTGADTC